MPNFFQMISSAVLWLGMRTRRVLAVDVVSLAFAVFIGYSLRLTYFLNETFVTSFYVTAALFSAIIIIVLFIGGVYKVVWPRAGVEEYARLAAWYWGGVCLFVIVDAIMDLVIIPRSSLIIFILTAFIFLTGTRAIWRMAYVGRVVHKEYRHRVLIVGAGNAGSTLARDMVRNSKTALPVGFVDDNPELLGMRIASLKVLGGRDDILSLVKKYDVDSVVIAMPSATGEQMKAYVKLLSDNKIPVRVLPSILDLADGQVNVSRLRSVKLEDLLRREPVTLDDDNINALIEGKTILVTGAGGSIGSEICRQVLARRPKELIALGHGEQSIYLLLESLADTGNTIPVTPVIADVADEAAMESLFTRYSPQVVFHAGAHKHVPLMEYNPREALRVNAYGTWNLASAAGRHGAERFVMISTDKAVHPTSVMGAAKRAAERLLQSVRNDFPNTKYMAVRFGNVLGSRGSVVPKFERQIAAGGSVTVTHPDMKRYFMLIPEAVSLVLQAGAMGEGGELFVLDMGEPVKISEMAETLIRLHGYEPHREIKIVYTGVRPGEKLYEELFYDPAHVDKTAHSKIFKSRQRADSESILPAVTRILNDAAEGSASDEKIKAEILALGQETPQGEE